MQLLGMMYQSEARPAPGFFEQSSVQLTISTTILFILVAVGYYVINKIRRGIKEEENSSQDLLTSFRDLYDRGEMDEEEFRLIKAKLGKKLLPESKISPPPPASEKGGSLQPGTSFPSMRIKSSRKPNLDGDDGLADGTSDSNSNPS